MLLESFNPIVLNGCIIPLENSEATPYSKQPLTGFSPITVSSSGSDVNAQVQDVVNRHTESMHLACKSLLALVKFQGNHVKVSIASRIKPDFQKRTSVIFILSVFLNRTRTLSTFSLPDFVRLQLLPRWQFRFTASKFLATLLL